MVESITKKKSDVKAIIKEFKKTKTAKVIATSGLFYNLAILKKIFNPEIWVHKLSKNCPKIIGASNCTKYSYS